MKPVIYTAIFGDYEQLKEPQVVTPGWDYVCYSDRVRPSNVWQTVVLPKQEDPRMLCRKLKIITPFYGLSIWIDGSFVINCDLNKFVEAHPGDFATMKHPLRDCVYEEGETCIKVGRGDPEKVREQIRQYWGYGMPQHTGLISSGILIRRFTSRVSAFCVKWYEHVKVYSNRDQLAFAFVDWRNPGVTTSYPFNYTTSKEFIYKKHEYKN